MSRVNKLSLVKQVQDALRGQLAIGVSKHETKKNEPDTYTDGRIYSWGTYNSYIKHANYFTSWCKEHYHCKTLEECRPHVNEYLQSRFHLSAYTVKLDAASIAKVYQCSTTEFVQTPARVRSDITRSRAEVTARDRHFSQTNNQDLIDFCKSTGLRRSELEHLHGYTHDGNPNYHEQDGKLYVHVDYGTKGGRVRQVEVIGNAEHVRTMMDKAGSGRVFSKVHDAADIHGYRREYATAVYNKYARPIDAIPYDKYHPGLGRMIQSQVYHGRNDAKGVVLDKVAMQIASQNLGHNRISVIAAHYLQH